MVSRGHEGIDANLFRRQEPLRGPPGPSTLGSHRTGRESRRRATPMRFLVKAHMDVEAANALARQGQLGSTIQSILEDLKPEAAYFVADEGQRTAYLIVDLQDPSQIPAP